MLTGGVNTLMRLLVGEIKKMPAEWSTVYAFVLPRGSMRNNAPIDLVKALS